MVTVTDDETVGVHCVQLSLCAKARENNSPLSVNSTERIWASNSLMGAPSLPQPCALTVMCPGGHHNYGSSSVGGLNVMYLVREQAKGH
jgi:hypothetical protein